jgi:hypothetical protein
LAVIARGFVTDDDLGRALQRPPTGAHVVGIAVAKQRRGAPAWHVAYELDVGGGDTDGNPQTTRRSASESAQGPGRAARP